MSPRGHGHIIITKPISILFTSIYLMLILCQALGHSLRILSPYLIKIITTLIKYVVNYYLEGDETEAEKS